MSTRIHSINTTLYLFIMEKQRIEADIIAMEKSALEKWNKGNPSGYLEIYAEDITYFDPYHNERIFGLENMCAFYEELRGQVAVDRCEMIDPKVQITENMAVLTYNLVSYSGELRYPWNCTEVYRLETDGKWRIIHNHWSFIRPMDLENME